MILRSLVLVFTVAATVFSAHAGQKDLTIFSDGVLLEIEVMAKKGNIELQMPGQIREGTVRVKPLEGGSVTKVELLPFKIADKQQKELDALAEQKNRLEDRIKALDTREGIFAAAAKSQSSKAPRKTKTNPDPLASVRQGTDFAIAQLEAVFTARRRTEQELKRIETRLANVSKKSIGGPTVKVTMTPTAARARIAVILSEGSWKPAYQIRLQGNGIANLTMLATTSNIPEGYNTKVVPASLSVGQQQQQAFPVPASGFAQLKEWQLPVEKEQISMGPIPSFLVVLKNSSNQSMPAGQAAIYASGEYIGTAPLPAMAVGASSTLSN
jgi:hypothetical protein